LRPKNTRYRIACFLTGILDLKLLTASQLLTWHVCVSRGPGLQAQLISLMRQLPTLDCRVSCPSCPLLAHSSLTLFFLHASLKMHTSGPSRVVVRSCHLINTARHSTAQACHGTAQQPWQKPLKGLHLTRLTPRCCCEGGRSPSTEYLPAHWAGRGGGGVSALACLARCTAFQSGPPAVQLGSSCFLP
jgi:hypothetical protein